MAETHLGTFFGAAGFLGDLVENCFKAFEFWKEVKSADDTAYGFVIRLQWQQARLHRWTMEWTIIERGSPSGISDPRFHQYPDAIANYLQLILNTVRNLTANQDSVPIFQNTRLALGVSVSERLAKLLNLSSVERHLESTENTSDNTSSLGQRLQWALQEGHAEKRLDLLTRLIGDLYSFLPPPISGMGYDPAGAIIFNPALTAEKNVMNLKRLSSHEDSDSFVRILAWLKATSMSHVNELKVSTAPSTEPSKLTGIVERMRRTDTDRHYLGKYNGNTVLIEKKVVPSEVKEKHHHHLRSRIDKVVHLLKISQKLTELRTLSCLGYIYSGPDDGTLKATGDCVYELLYSVESDQVESLRDMLRSRNIARFRSALSLDKRFEIARSLSKAILYLHTAEWLHKGICSHNVMFVSSRFSALMSQRSNDQFSLPYLVGFDYSRIDSPSEGTETMVGNVESNLYRHPDVQGKPHADPKSYLGDTGRFLKNHDIYSLGVILVELGVLKSAMHIKEIAKKYDPSYGEHTANGFRNLLMDKVIPEVLLKMGGVYATVALRCLQADFYQLPVGVHHDGAVEYYKDVVTQLNLCKA